MTCYQRHLKSMFDVLGLEYDQANRKRVDVAIRQVLGLSDDVHCPEIRLALKALSEAEREALPARVSELL